MLDMPSGREGSKICRRNLQIGLPEGGGAFSANFLGQKDTSNGATFPGKPPGNAAGSTHEDCKVGKDGTGKAGVEVCHD